MQSIVELVSGTVAGFSYACVIHPFDTIKVRMQNARLRTGDGATACIRRTCSQEGPMAFFKGLSSPLASQLPVNAFVFASYEQALRMLRHGEFDPRSNRALLHHGLAGLFAGAVNTPIITLFDLLKIRCQLQTGKTAYQSPVRVAQSILRHEGLPGLFRGQVATFLRETTAYSSQFLCYQLVQRHLQNHKLPTSLSTICAGALSGACCWTLSYPFDTVKTRIQQQSYKQSSTYRVIYKDGGFVDCWTQLVREGGRRRLMFGCLPIMLAAMPANAALFLTYEFTMQTLTSSQTKTRPRQDT